MLWVAILVSGVGGCVFGSGVNVLWSQDPRYPKPLGGVCVVLGVLLFLISLTLVPE